MKYYPVAVMQGLDRDGDPVYIDRAGVTDPSGLVKRFGREELYKYAVWLREGVFSGEWQEDYYRRVGRRVRRMTIIFDLHGFSSKQMNSVAVEGLKISTRMVQENYPGQLKRMIIVRAPAIFRAFWGIMKHLIPKANHKRILFAPGQDAYLEFLEQYMDRRVLPPCLDPEKGEGHVVKDLLGVELHGGELPPPSDNDFLRLDMFKSDATANTEIEDVSERSKGLVGKCVRAKRLASGYWETPARGLFTVYASSMS